ncbi:hypothetical protein M1513_00020 [Patescibacteria group bacterium]|nr:hypothetical protein [Patescibacteria group bacterium]
MFIKISKYCLYAALFSVLIVLPTTFFPFIGGKDYFFRVAVELALIFLWLIIYFIGVTPEIFEL